jgi:hypothetical protein
MRIETPGLLHVLKGLALVGAYVLFWRFGFNFSELTYQLSKVNWVSASFFIVPVLLLLSIPAWRLWREYRIWKVLYQPFHVIDDPFIDVDLKEESIGDAVLANGHTVKQTATFASRSGVVVRKAAYPKMFPTFEITWDQVSNVYFAEMQDTKFGSDSLGMARVTLNFAEEFVLVLPWRERFNQYLPEHIGLQKETLIG